MITVSKVSDHCRLACRWVKYSMTLSSDIIKKTRIDVILKNIKKHIKAGTSLMAALLILSLTSCSPAAGDNEKPSAPPFDGKTYEEISTITAQGENPEEYAAGYQPMRNYDTQLSVPTYVTKVDDTYFIVDCYHNRIIYSTEMGIPLDQWYIMSSDLTQPHTLASDGKVYITDDTENNRILVFEKYDGKFINTQSLYNVGTRPHYTVYDKATDTFYVWSSVTGELYCFRHTADSTRIYLTEVKKIPQLDGIYVRSFSIIDGDIYFVSGVSEEGTTPKIYRCSLTNLSVKESFDIPEAMAGMAQITKIGKYYYITVSTDLKGNQDSATIIRTTDLSGLSKGDYEDVYSDYFIGGGTPYYISEVEGTYYLTEHRLKGHGVWSFTCDNEGNITNITAVY